MVTCTIQDDGSAVMLRLLTAHQPHYTLMILRNIVRHVGTRASWVRAADHPRAWRRLFNKSISPDRKCICTLTMHCSQSPPTIDKLTTFCETGCIQWVASAGGKGPLSCSVCCSFTLCQLRSASSLCIDGLHNTAVLCIICWVFCGNGTSVRNR